MPFSSVLGASSVIKPGVVTSSTRPSAPYVGQLIFETDTNRLAVYNGSSWIMLADADTPPGLELVKTQTIGTAVSSVTVSDVFSSTYENYYITVSGGVASTNSFGSVKLGSTTTGYYYWEMYGNYNSTSVLGTNAQNAAAWPDIVGGTADSVMGAFELFSPNLAKNTHIISRSSSARTIGGGAMVFGYLANTTQYTEFTLTPGSGTYTGGTIRVYGYRNS